MEILRRRGECLILTGKAGEGLEVLAGARTRAKKLGDRFEEGVILRCLAEGLRAVGHLGEALEYANTAASALEKIDARHEHAIARLVAADILLDLSRDPDVEAPRDRLDEAWEHTLVAQAICRQLDIEHWTSRVKRTQSQIARRRAEEVRYAHSEAPGSRGQVAAAASDIIIAESRSMKEALQAVDAFGPYDEPILLTGETGTGKEVIARLLHRKSARAERAFVAVNVPAIPESMFEREFFGHVKGAFSGAESDREGLAAAADGGTLFLDEIGDLDPAAQTKLLRLLQDGSYLCLGDPNERRADLRVIAATNTDLERAVAAGRFREDLYYRLATLTIPLPALRDRPEDIEPLLDHFLSLSAGRQARADEFFHPVSLKLLEKYGWPGNVREVALVARRAYITRQTLGRVEVEVGSGIDAMVLRGPEQAAMAAAGASAGAAADGKDATSLNRARILLALEESGGNRSEAARQLGVSRATFYRWLDRLDLA
jgi:two-component system response regulator HydG